MVVVWRPHYQESKEVIYMEKNTSNHSAHSTWRCQLSIPRKIAHRDRLNWAFIPAGLSSFAVGVAHHGKM